MSWYSNGNTENSYDEITLHRAGAKINPRRIRETYWCAKSANFTD
jgi:hypothetical protein